VVGKREREREKEQKKIFHWFISVKDLRKRRRKNEDFFFFSFFVVFQRISFVFSLLTCQRAVWHRHTRDEIREEKEIYC
jgi:hypothetical protein